MRIGLLFGLVSLIWACSESDDNTTTIDLGYNYYPVAPGSTWIYQVDSLAYDDNTGKTNIDTFSYEYKEVIQSVVRSNGDGSYDEWLVDRFYRYADTLDWNQANSWRIIKTPEKLNKIEENISFTKLVFPLASRKEWNGNMANQRDKEMYTVKFFDMPFGNYPQACKIEQLREENLIEEMVREEVYARQVGMVYAINDSLNTQVKGTRGYRIRKQLKQYTP